jgi:hypothetical protein
MRMRLVLPGGAAQEAGMAASGSGKRGSDKAKSPDHEGGAAVRDAPKWSGGAKGSKGVTPKA